MKPVLITGGAGYIGSHFADLYLKKKDNVIIFDSLDHGYKEAFLQIKKRHPGKKIQLIVGDLKSKKDLRRVFEKYQIDSVVHFAAFCQVNESVNNPDLYFENNVTGSINLLNEMSKHNIKNLIFSSTCAVYGETKYLPVDENHPTNPTNPYGVSKLIVELMLPWYENKFNMKYVILRYFNVCGAMKNGKIGYGNKRKQNLLVQDAVKAAVGIHPLHLTYSEVNTRDQTPIRDYVDVLDLSNAHLKAISYLKKGGTSQIINLGTGKGYSVKEIISEVEKTLNKKIEVVMGERRKGEYAQIYASNLKAKKILNWSPTTPLKDSILSLSKWYKQNPQGYKK